MKTLSLLSLEWCRKLEGWGFPQDGYGFWYVDKSPTEELTWLFYSNPSEGFGSDFRIKAPSLEELLEWAKEKCDGVLLSNLNQDWRATNGKTIWGVDPDPKVAICRLLEQVKEKI